MRRTLIALAAVAGLLAACGQPSETPASGTAPAEAAPAPEMPADAPPQEEVVAPPQLTPTPTPAPSEGDPGSCLAEIGAEASARLVERCRQVSPATRPPCNAANPCELIQGEIDRACALWDRDGDPPAECAA